MPSDTHAALAEALRRAGLALDLGKAMRATRHQDGTTPEAVTTHTVMLMLILDALHPPLDMAKAMRYALVHDLVEAKCGDTDTLGATTEALAAKAEREAAALASLAADMPDLAATIHAYEAQVDTEAQYVGYLDKILPKLTHALNRGAMLAARGYDVEHTRQRHDEQCVALRERYPLAADGLEALYELAARCSEEALAEREAAVALVAEWARDVAIGQPVVAVGQWRQSAEGTTVQVIGGPYEEPYPFGGTRPIWAVRYNKPVEPGKRNKAFKEDWALREWALLPGDPNADVGVRVP